MYNGEMSRKMCNSFSFILMSGKRNKSDQTHDIGCLLVVVAAASLSEVVGF